MILKFLTTVSLLISPWLLFGFAPENTKAEVIKVKIWCILQKTCMGTHLF